MTDENVLTGSLWIAPHDEPVNKSHYRVRQGPKAPGKSGESKEIP